MATHDEEILPPNVRLRDPDDFDTLRSDIYDGMKKEITSSFPHSYGGVRTELHDVDYADPEHFSLAEQKQALLSEKFLGRRLKGTLRLVDENTGNVLDEKPGLTLMRVPYLTPRGTFIHGGNEYTTILQSRLLPGIYTRKQDNGEFETQFNIKPGTGTNFRVGLEPATSQYRLRVQAANLHLYSLLHDLGVPDEHLEKMWGPEVWEANKNKYDKRVFDKAYARLVPRRSQTPEATHEDKVLAIKAALDGMQVHAGVARKNLPNLFDLEKAAAWRAAALGRQVAEAEMEKSAALEVFEPTLTAVDVVGVWATFPEFSQMRKAAAADFDPDLEPDDMQESVRYLYGHHGPRLASMKHWPDHWFPAGSNAMGWIGWYTDYANGKRTDDDDRQIKRWKSFKARNVPSFVKSPTARRAFSLMNWAIDPVKLVEDPEAKSKLKEEMDAYRKEKWRDYRAKQAVFSATDYKALATFLNRECQAGLDVDAPTDELAAQIMEFLQSNDIDPGLLQVATEGANAARDEMLPAIPAPPKPAQQGLPDWAKASAFVQTRDEDEKEETERQRQAEEDADDFKKLLISGGLLVGGTGLAAIANKAYGQTGGVNEQFDRFVATTQSQPESWKPDFNPQRMIQDYVTEGSRVMRSQIYGQPLLEHVRHVREGLGKVPGVNSKWAWKNEFIQPPKEIASDIDWSNPDFAKYVKLDPKGHLQGVNDSALHYMAFQTGPLTAYKQLWSEYDPQNLKHMDRLLTKWKNSLPAEDQQTQGRYDNFYHGFDDFVKTRDPRFWQHKQEMEDSMGRTLRDTSKTYAELGGAGRQLGVNVPKYVGVGAALVGAGGLGYWLWNKHKKRQEAKAALETPAIADLQD